MDTTRIEKLRTDIMRALVDASSCMTGMTRGWLRDLPAFDGTTPGEQAIYDWAETVKCVRGEIENRVCAAGTSIEAARAYLRAYDLCSDALALLQEPVKASCESCAGGGGVCSECDGIGVTFGGARAA